MGVHHLVHFCHRRIDRPNYHNAEPVEGSTVNANDQRIRARKRTTRKKMGVLHRDRAYIWSVLVRLEVVQGNILNMAQGVTEKQEVFCYEYCVDYNGKRAYMVAYPRVKESTARVNASRLLTKANIQARIEELKTNLAETAGISALKILKALEDFAFSDITETFDVTPEELKKMPEKVRRLITGYKLTTRSFINSDNRTVKEEVLELKFADKLKAFEMMNKMLGHNSAEKVIQTNVNVDATKLSKEDRRNLNQELEDEF